MASLMRRHADCGGRCDIVHGVRQANDVVLRVKMIRQLAGHMLHAHIGHAVRAQHRHGGLRAGHAARIAHLTVAAERALDMGAGPERQDHRREHQNDIVPVYIEKRHCASPRMEIILIFN